MKTLGKTLGWIVWLVLASWGASGVIERLTHGHLQAHYGSYVPWGLWVSAYIYFIGLSAGAFLLSSLIYVFGVSRLAKIGRIALFTATITLVMALLSIWFDLGHMERNYEVFTRPNFSSMMAWMVWLYTGYFVLILSELWLDMRCDLARLADRGGVLSPLYRLLSLGWRCPKGTVEVQACHQRSLRALRVLGAIGVPLAIAFHGGVGALFATLASRPYWHSSLFPILFLTGALVSGGALLLAIVAVFGADLGDNQKSILRLLSRIVLGLLVLDMVLEWSETSIPLWYGVGPDVDLYHEILFGRFWYVFWIVHLLLGAVIPLVLLLAKPTSRVATGTAGVLIAVTFLAVRLNLVIPGQITPALEGLREAYVDARLKFEYIPSAFEWSVVAFVVALGIALFWVGNRVLPLKETQPQTH